MTTKIPQIPNVSEETVIQVLEALKNTVEVREGKLGDQLDRTVTFRDLIGLQLAQDKNQEEVHDINKINNMPVYTNNYDFTVQYDPTTDLTPPPQANDINVSSTIGAIFLRWGIPSYRNHSFSEIWRSQNGNIGDAVLIAQSTTGFYTDPVETNVKYFYWIRLVSKADVRSAYSQDSVSGQAEINPKLVIEAIEGEINSESLTQDLQTRLLDIENANQDILASDPRALIAQEAEIRENVEEGLLSQYTVKIDDNGAISGFGLASQNVDGSVESAFIIRADKFAIVQPTSTSTTLTGTPASASIPFTVDSDGRTIIKSGVLGSASITNANISSLKAHKITAGLMQQQQMFGGQALFNTLYAGNNAVSSVISQGAIGDADGDPIAFNTPTSYAMKIDGTYAVFATSYFVIADSNGAYNPFVVDSNGITRIASAMIQNASITSAKIGNQIFSDNYFNSAGVATGNGWLIDKNGDAFFNNLSLSGFATTNQLNAVSTTANLAQANAVNANANANSRVAGTGGTLTAGLVKSTDGKMQIDLANKSITIST